MFQTFIVVSFYTAGTLYEEEAVRLQESLHRLGIEHEILPRPNLGNWVSNCAMKATFIEEMLQSYGKPVVWLDADAEVMQPLDLFQSAQFDFAVREREAKIHPRFGPWNSGTLYFGTSPEAMMLVALWVQRSAACPDELDQMSLYQAYHCMVDPPTTEFLPWSYCTIFDERGRPAEPHVLHHQASRRLKRTVGPVK